MSKIKIIPQGEEAKFQITIDDFNMTVEDFDVTLIYGYRRTELHIPQRQMLQDEEGNWYFTFGTAGMVGRVEAECHYYIHDGDFPDRYKTMVDRQYLVFVATNPYPNFISCPPCDEPKDRKVHYELITETDIATDYVRLCTMSGLPLRTADGEDLMVLQERE